MSDITFELLKLFVMVLSCIIARYLIPWLKSGIDSDQEARAKEIITDAVFMVQQLYSAESGEVRKQKAIEYIKKIVDIKGFTISDEEIDTIIEAVVKQLKIAEGR